MDVYIRGSLVMNNENERLDSEFLEAVYRSYYKNVYNYISFRINNHFDSEELASSVFENAIKKFHTYKPGAAPIEAWLIGIAKNVVADYFRSRKRKFFTPLDNILELRSPGREPEEIIVMNEENKALIEAIAKLKEKERQVLSMKFATDLKNTEIAKIMGISDSNVGIIIYRSIKKLKKLLGEEEVI